MQSWQGAVFLCCVAFASFVCISSAIQECAMDKKIAIITGATGQIGREIAVGVAKTGRFSPILLTCRDEVRGKKLVEEISAETHGVSAALFALQCGVDPPRTKKNQSWFFVSCRRESYLVPGTSFRRMSG